MTINAKLRALYERRRPLLSIGRSETPTPEAAAELASVEAQIDVLQMAEMVLAGHLDRDAALAAKMGKLREGVEALMAATNAHEKRLAGDFSKLERAAEQAKGAL